MSKSPGECPICKQAIQPGEDAVVCPDCGTPYHRACWQQQGQCTYADKHGTGYEYTPPAPKVGNEPEAQRGAAQGYSAATMACPACGASNNTRNIFCDRCGTPLHGSAPNGNGTQQAGPFGMGTGPFGPGAMGGEQQPGQMPFTPFGPQVDLSGDIDGIPKKDWNVYIGKSAPVYLTRLDVMQQRKSSISYMFSAFFIPEFFFAYRKMWGMATATVVLSLLFTMPTLINLVMLSGYDVLGLTAANIEILSNVTWILSLIMRFLCGVFALYLYRRSAGKKIKKLREKFPVDADYQAALAQQGGTSTVAVVAVIAVTVAVYLLFYMNIDPQVLLHYYYGI